LYGGNRECGHSVLYSAKLIDWPLYAKKKQRPPTRAAANH